MPIRKYAKKALKSVARGLGRRYVKKGQRAGLKTMNYNQISRDIMMLKNVVNAEKKFFDYEYNNAGTKFFTVGQTNGTLSGAFCLDVTPLIAVGSTVSQRNGNSVKLTSALYQFQLEQMSAMTLDTKLIIEFWSVKGQYEPASQLLTNTFSPSTFSQCIDTMSPRNQDKFSDYKLIRRVIKTQKADQLTGTASVSTFDIPVKFNRGKGHHIRLNNDNTDILNGQIYMTIRCGIGNASSSIVTTGKNVPSAMTAINTGQFVRFAYKVWYYDN